MSDKKIIITQKKEISVGAIVFNSKGEILLLKRADKKENYWEFPKGHQKKDEKRIETLKREIYEETNITNFQIIPNFLNYNKYINKKGNLRIIELYAIISDDEITISKEHLEYIFLKYEDAIKLINIYQQEILRKAYFEYKK